MTRFLGNNSLSGSLPSSRGYSLRNLDFSYNQLSGDFPSWASDKNLQLNLVANNFVIDRSISDNSFLPSWLECLQRNTPCFLGSPHSSSFAVNCGSNTFISASDSNKYQSDGVNLGASSYYVKEDVTRQPTWGVSNVGIFMGAPYGIYIIDSRSQFQNTLDSELFQTARMSTSSLRYYGIGLENGNYSVTLQFAEFAIEDTQSWTSLGRRAFDIYVQGERKEKNFDIRKAAGDKSFAVVRKQYNVPVTRNFIEIHLFWAGKGTCCIPTQGYYGPVISALSVTPNFVPTVRNAADQNKSTSKTGVIVGVVVGVTVLGLAALVGIFLWRQKRRKLSLDLQELYSIVGRPNVFSYGELRSSTENFSSSNLLGEGGYGTVYKAWELYENHHPLGIVDPELTEFNEDEVLRAIHVALLCTQDSPHQRPSMSRVVSMLTGDVEVAKVVTKPSYISVWQIKGGNTSFMDSNVSGESSLVANDGIVSHLLWEES